MRPAKADDGCQHEHDEEDADHGLEFAPGFKVVTGENQSPVVVV